jgi:site-specific recombinase XerD
MLLSSNGQSRKSICTIIRTISDAGSTPSGLVLSPIMFRLLRSACTSYSSDQGIADLPALFISERRQRMSKRAIQDSVSNWCRKLGISPIHVHQFRHQYGTRLANAGLDIMVLKTLTGHQDPRTTGRYFEIYDHTLSREYHAAMEIARPSQA